MACSSDDTFSEALSPSLHHLCCFLTPPFILALSTSESVASISLTLTTPVLATYSTLAILCVDLELLLKFGAAPSMATRIRIHQRAILQSFMFPYKPMPGSFSSSFVLHVPSEIFDSACFGVAFTSCLGYFMSQIMCLPAIFLDSSEGSF